MTTDTQSATLLEPPAELESLERGRWLARPPTDPVVAYLEAEHWSGTTNLPTWQAARLSHAVYLYRETGTQWAAVAKHYTVKTGRDALRHAEAERERLQQAIAAGLAEGPIRAVRFLSLWRGILFQEYVDGLTLEDLIAIRTTRPGVLESALQRVAQLLVTLHTGGVQPDREPEFSPAVSYTNRLVDELGR